MIKSVIIGAGFIGDQHAQAIQNSNIVKLTAIVDSNEARAKEMAEKYNVAYYTDAEKMFETEKPDMADICLPTFLHEKFVLSACGHGVNIICEKPVALTLKSMDCMMDAAKRSGIKFMVAQVVRFWPEYEEIKKIYRQGVFGEIKMIYAARLAQHPNWTEWHKDPGKSGGGLFDLHLHDIDYLYGLLGPVETVYSTGWQSGYGCWNHVMTTLKFKNGASAAVEGAFQMTENFPFTMKFRIVGESVAADYNMIAGFNLEDVSSSTRSLMFYENGKDPRRINADESQNAYQNELEYFAACIENDRPTDMVPIEESREVIRIALAIQKSLETGGVVKL